MSAMSEQEPPEKKREETSREKRRPVDQIPQLDRKKLRLLDFGMSFVYWGAALISVLVAITVLTNLGSGDKPDSQYLMVAGGAFVFAILLSLVGFRTYRSASKEDSPDPD